MSGTDELVRLLLSRCAQLAPLVSRHRSDSDAVRNALDAFAGRETIVRDATMIASGRFPALGMCIAEPSGRFDWHRDYGSGKVWPQEPFHRIRYLDGDGADVKYVWELSRMYWIAWLGKAYLLSGDEKWATEFRRLIDDWSSSNPPDVGVNWTVAMEVGIRSFWLATGAAFFGSSPTIPASWWLDYFALLWSHASYVMHNLEYFPNLTNHYIANCFGLLVAGAVLRDSNEGRRWFEEGKKRLAIELERQITPDGVNYERSFCYHALVLEMYLIAAVAAERAGSPFGADAMKIVERMAEFAADYTPPGSATIPQFGDSDDGAILRLRSDQNHYDHRRLVALAGEIFNRDDFRALGGNHREDVLLLFGIDAARRRNLQVPRERGSRLYRPGGFAVLRNKDLHVVADTGEIGLHGNNDTLAFTLHSSDGTAWLVDPGTGCYTRDGSLRNALRSTAAHNAPYIDSTEIAEFAGLWRVKEDRTRPRIVDTNIEDDRTMGAVTLSAEHRAYDRLPAGGVRVRRRWTLDDTGLAVRDTLDGSGVHDVAIRFTVPGDVAVSRIDERTVELTPRSDAGDGPRLEFRCSHLLDISDGFYSPSYGVVLPAVRIEILAHGSPPLEIDYFYRLFS